MSLRAFLRSSDFSIMYFNSLASEVLSSFSDFHISQKNMNFRQELAVEWCLPYYLSGMQNIVSSVLSNKPKSRLARRRFSQKTNKQICFVCCEKQISKQNKFIGSYFGRIYSVPICFRFYLTFRYFLDIFPILWQGSDNRTILVI